MTLKQKIVISCYLIFITGIAIWEVWKQPTIHTIEKITYPNAKYAIGDVVWHFTYHHHYLFDGSFILNREWECDTIKKITIYKDKTKSGILYNGYTEMELFDIDDSTIALCNMIENSIDSLVEIQQKLKCMEKE